MGGMKGGMWSRRVARAQAAADRRNANYMAAADPNAISHEEAARLLGRSEVHGLVMRGVLEPAVMTSGFPGVTKESVDRELEWQRTSTRWQRARRRAQEVLDWMSIGL